MTWIDCPLRVPLTWREVALGGEVGVHRRIHRLAKARRDDGYGYPNEADVWTREVNGALAELAVAKALNVYWTAMAQQSGPDVCGLHVRWAARPELVVRPYEDDDWTYVLVTGTPIVGDATLTIHGSYRGGDAKQHPEWQRAPGGVRPAFFVPAEAIDPEVRVLSSVRARATAMTNGGDR